VIRRREFLAAPALLAQPRRPLNILLLFPDQWRPDWMPSLGPVRTPNLEKLAARGVRFSNALTPAPLCAPARACLASGKEYSRCGVASNGVDYPLEQTTFYTLLQRAGYHTMACGKVDLHKKSHIWGLDGKTRTREWGFSDAIDNAGKGDAIASGAESPKDPYMAMLHARSLAKAHVDDFRRRSKEGYAATWNTPLPDDAYCDNWIGRNALSLLSAAPKDKPWFLQVNFTGPHNPMDITARMEPPVRGRPMPAPQHCSLYDTATHQRIRQNYSAMCDNIDRLCGDILARVDLDNTLVVFSSDHGEMLGDHNKWGKTYPYQASAGVPLLIAGPGIRPAKHEGPATILDLGATFLDYAGASVPQDMDSRSLRPLLEGKSKTHRPAARSGLGSWRLAFDGRWKLITGFDPAAGKNAAAGSAPPVLFDLRNDPSEHENLAASAPRELERLKQWL
jgi:arylsulfatase A-like enzyme